MHEAISMACAFLSFAALHAAKASRLPIGLRARVQPWPRRTLQALALAFFLASVHAWRVVEPGPASVLVPLWTLILCGSVIVTVRPLVGAWSWALPIVVLLFVSALCVARGLA
ncbi:MAG: hypothetical protein ABW252_15500 [Polyangiales bacterium]